MSTISLALVGWLSSSLLLRARLPRVQAAFTSRSAWNARDRNATSRAQRLALPLHAASFNTRRWRRGSVSMGHRGERGHREPVSVPLLAAAHSVRLRPYVQAREDAVQLFRHAGVERDAHPVPARPRPAMSREVLGLAV